MKRGEQNVNVPEGWVLVPVKLTRDMLDVINKRYYRHQDMWDDILEAAPVPPVEQRGVAE